MKKEKPQKNSEKTKNNILRIAKSEFSNYGYDGTRVDKIATKAKINKNMIYYYFGSKENLFKKVLEIAYRDIREAEKSLDFSGMDAEEQLKHLIKFTWEYFFKNPEFLRFINNVNLHKAKHIKDFEDFRKINLSHIELTEKILKQGVREKKFREGLSAFQVNISIAALGFYYLSNQYTLSIIFDTQMTDKKALDERLEVIMETILRYVKR